MLTPQEIRDLKSYLINQYHSERLKEQTTDKSFHEDTFAVEHVEDEFIVRTGKARKMINNPVAHIITSNPQVFRDSGKKGKVDADLRVASLLNKWAKYLLRQNPNPYKEFAIKLQSRGEAWIYLPHNPNWDKEDPNSIPAAMRVLDPLVVFVDDVAGEPDGVPNRVIVCYDRIARHLLAQYPQWSPLDVKNMDEKVPFFMFWDNDIRYFEAGLSTHSEPLLRDGDGNLANGDGRQENPYKFPPFVHAYSGFGESSESGNPASLACSRIRPLRDLLKEQCAIRSTINMIIYQFANKHMDLIYDSTGPEPTGDIGANYDRGLRAFNIMGFPPNAELKEGIEQLPGPELWNHLYQIESKIAQEDPLILSGVSTGTSGRQDDVGRSSALAMFDSVVDNTANSFATAFGLILKMCDALNWKLPSLWKNDIDNYYKCTLELKADDPIAADRLSLRGGTLYQQGQIDLMTNLTTYQGYTEEDAKKIIARILVDKVTIQSPEIAQMLGFRFAQESGAEDYLKALQQARTQMQGGATLPAPEQVGSRGGEPRTGNIKAAYGQEQSTYQRGERERAMA